ncbi:oxidoreductase, aldo/keto reductase family [Lentilactobacillus kosonis]|uniref:Oxidoreductase, aldo/keto reductase family n=1 Tax=Lentilactobacillus kosonis TaxID=2810561 RepID=A0A401FIH6_9LACO|nr:oxidoreductase, aldo/keto reductase family [Lentilactobacillus kosonis]
MVIKLYQQLALALGTWVIRLRISAMKLRPSKQSIKAGARVIDTAEMYGNGNSEQLVGQAIQNLDRKELFIIDKVLPNNASSDQLPKSLDASLARVGTDYFDLYLYHWRGGIPLPETVKALQDAQNAGKIRHWGVSNFDLADMKELLSLPGGSEVAANEDLYNLGSRGTEFDLQSWQVNQKIPFIAYTPIAQGDRFGQQLTTNRTIQAIAEEHQATPYQILLAWTIRSGNVLAIPQTSDPIHAAENVKAGDIEFTEEELELIDNSFPKPTNKQPLDIL